MIGEAGSALRGTQHLTRGFGELGVWPIAMHAGRKLHFGDCVDAVLARDIDEKSELHAIIDFERNVPSNLPSNRVLPGQWLMDMCEARMQFT